VPFSCGARHMATAQTRRPAPLCPLWARACRKRQYRSSREATCRPTRHPVTSTCARKGKCPARSGPTHRCEVRPPTSAADKPLVVRLHSPTAAVSSRRVWPCQRLMQQAGVAVEIGVVANNQRCDLRRPAALRAGGGRRLSFHQDGIGAGPVLFKVLECLGWTPRPAAPSGDGAFQGGKAASKVHIPVLPTVLSIQHSPQHWWRRCGSLRRAYGIHRSIQFP